MNRKPFKEIRSSHSPASAPPGWERTAGCARSLPKSSAVCKGSVISWGALSYFIAETGELINDH
jgi:hypothetical protein